MKHWPNLRNSTVCDDLKPETSEASFEEVTIEESSLKVEAEVKSDPDPVSTILQEFMTC